MPSGKRKQANKSRSGQQLAQIMIEEGIGVKHRPVELYEDQIEELFETS
jgi:hypothetical protein